MLEILRRSLKLLPLAILQQFGRLAMTVLLARCMELDSYGAFATLYVLIEILVQPATIGLGQSFVRFGARYFRQAQHALLSGLHRFSLWTVSLAGGLLTSVMVLFAVPLVEGTATHDGLPWLLVAVPLGALVQIQAACLLATRHPQLALLTRNLLPEWLTLGFAFVILLGVSQLTVHAALWAVLLGFLLTLGFQWTRTRGVSPRAPAEYRTGEWLRVSLPLMMSASGTALITRLDLFFVRVIENEAAVALFFPPVVIAGLTMIPVNAIGTVCKPRLATGSEGSDDPAFRSELFHMARALFLSNSLLVLTLALLGPWLLMLYGERHEAEALPLVLIMLGGRLLVPVRVVSNAALKLAGNPWYATASFGIGSVTAIVAALWLHGLYGVEGLATGFVLGFAVGIVARLAFVRSSLGLPLALVCGLRLT